MKSVEEGAVAMFTEDIRKSNEMGVKCLRVAI